MRYFYVKTVSRLGNKIMPLSLQTAAWVKAQPLGG